MTTMPPRHDNGQHLPAPDPAGAVEDRLQLAEVRLVCCRDELADARREVRALRRQERRERVRALRAKVGPRISACCFVGLAGTGSAGFVVAVVLLLMGELSKAKDVLTFAGVAWGGAAAIRTRRR